MAGPNADNVLTGVPDQKVTGAILSGDRIETVPEDPFVSNAFTGLEGSGYVSEDGLELAISRSFASIKDWSGAIVKKMLEEFDGTLKWAHLETNEQSLKNTFGEDNVEVTAPTNASGTRIKVSINASQMPHKGWVFKMKDGNARVVIVVPDGQVGETDEVAFVANDAIKWGVTLNTFPDANGNSIYIFTDDGVFSA